MGTCVERENWLLHTYYPPACSHQCNDHVEARTLGIQPYCQVCLKHGLRYSSCLTTTPVLMPTVKEGNGASIMIQETISQGKAV